MNGTFLNETVLKIHVTQLLMLHLQVTVLQEKYPASYQETVSSQRTGAMELCPAALTMRTNNSARARFVERVKASFSVVIRRVFKKSGCATSSWTALMALMNLTVVCVIIVQQCYILK